VSAPLSWDEVPDAEIADFPLDTFSRDRYAAVGDLTAGIDEAVGDLGSLLELARRDAAEGLGDAPWPPHFPKQPDEPPRVQPSRRRAAGGDAAPPATDPAPSAGDVAPPATGAADPGGS
jgi:hypothetical protein